MVNQRLLLTLVAAYLASAVPLNINLGAYSPALVVGDGSIEFGSSPERASQVLQTLATGAENGAVPAGQAARTGQQGQQANGQGTTINPAPQVEKKNVLSKRSEPSVEVEKRAPEPYTVKADFQISGTTSAEPESEIARRIKRDIDGFREALNFARDAQKNQPKVVLDAGITVFPGTAVPINSAANGALPPTTGNGAQPAKREISSQSKREDKLGMTLIAIGEI